MLKFGLIGKKLGHSFSKTIHEELFRLNNIDACYDLIELDEPFLGDFLFSLKDNYQGINVTIPFKEKVIPYLDYVSDDVKKIGACNTIKVVDGKLYGYNTDYLGFMRQLDYYQIDVKNKNVFILGSGGASKACKYALSLLGANVTVISRTGEYNYQYLEEQEDIDIIVNTTPLGMWPNVDTCPISKEVADKAKTLIDVVFNPKQTKFLELKDSHFNGLPMLVYQAIEAEHIWLSKDFADCFTEVIKKL